MTEKVKRKPEESGTKICDRESIISATHMRSLIYSSTSRPGLANPPVSIKKEAWYKLIKNGWIVNIITSIAFLAAGYYLGIGGPNAIIILLAAGAALAVGAILLLIFYVSTLIYLAATPP